MDKKEKAIYEASSRVKNHKSVLDIDGKLTSPVVDNKAKQEHYKEVGNRNNSTK